MGFDLLLGEDFLSVTSVEFDLPHQVVRIMQPSGCKPDQLPYWAKTYSMAELLASPRDARAIRVSILLNGHAVRAVVDSGASRSVVSRSVADEAGVTYVGGGGELVGLGRESLATSVGKFRTFTLGDETINNVQLQVAQLGKHQTTQKLGSRIPEAAVIEPNMLLGADFLRSHRVFIDNSSRRMVFTYEGGPVFLTTKPAQPTVPGAAAGGPPPQAESMTDTSTPSDTHDGPPAGRQ
jgi:Aspartyl protease